MLSLKFVKQLEPRFLAPLGYYVLGRNRSDGFKSVTPLQNRTNIFGQYKINICNCVGPVGPKMFLLSSCIDLVIYLEILPRKFVQLNQDNFEPRPNLSRACNWVPEQK